MINVPIIYEDYNGNLHTDTFWFHLTKVDLYELQEEFQKEFQEDMQAYLTRIAEAKDKLAILEAFKKIVLKAYGKKSEDGMRFIKSKEYTEEFMQTEAFSELVMSLSTDEKAQAFIQGILPKFS